MEKRHDEVKDLEQHIDAFLTAVKREVYRAANLFPTNEHQLAAMHEESGEVAKAFIDYDRGKETRSGVYNECVQAAAMNAVLAVNGTAEHTYDGPIEVVDLGPKPE